MNVEVSEHLINPSLVAHPPNLFFTTTPYKNSHFIKETLENIRKKIFTSNGQIQIVDLFDESYTDMSETEFRVALDEFENIKQIKLIIVNMLNWQELILIQGWIPNKELERKQKFIEAQKDIELKQYLNGILDQLISVEVVSPLEVINRTNNKEDIFNSLFELQLMNIFNTSENYRARTADEISESRPFKNKDELATLLEKKINYYELLIKSLKTAADIEELAELIRYIDNTLLDGLTQYHQIMLLNKIFDTKDTLSYYQQLADLVNSFKGLLKINHNSVISL